MHYCRYTAISFIQHMNFFTEMLWSNYESPRQRADITICLHTRNIQWHTNFAQHFSIINTISRNIKTGSSKHVFLNIPYFAESTCWAQRQKTKPHSCLISIKFAVWNMQYPNFKCCEYDSDRLSSFWDIASQSEKSGGMFIQADAFIRQNTVGGLLHQLKCSVKLVLKATCIRSLLLLSVSLTAWTDNTHINRQRHWFILFTCFLNRCCFFSLLWFC